MRNPIFARAIKKGSEGIGYFPKRKPKCVKMKKRYLSNLRVSTVEASLERAFK